MVGEWWGRVIIRFPMLLAMLILDAPRAMPPGGPLPPWFLPVLSVALGIASLIGAYAFNLDMKRADEDRAKRIAQLQQKADEAPEKARYAWDLAREKLEAYFNRNLAQVRLIFYVAVSVMLIGFGFILWGLRLAVADPEHVKVALIASGSGIITQFISLTFMVIYKSTILQATQFMSILERINTVGMAVGILDSIKDEEGQLKDTTRVDIIRLLLATPSSQMSFTPRKRKLKAKLDNSATP